MAELKTKKTQQDVEAFLNSVEHDKRREDSFVVLELMKEATGEEPKMWGTSIVGYGDYHYKYESGRENDWFLVGFSPRKQALTLYIMAGFDNYQGLLENLGKYKKGKGCIYVNKIEDINLDTLRELVAQSAEHVANSNH
ncbi:MAG: DUF1801 domain-containing protein [Candidatus Promineifilaceae bacterium]